MKIKKKIYFKMIFFMILILLVLLLSINIIKAKTDPLSIRVAINEGSKYKYTIIDPIKNAIEGYYWVVNNSEYVIDTYLIDITDIRNGKLTTDNYDVHIIDGVSDEFFGCYRYPFDTKDDTLRSFLDEFIVNGGGYIGRCGGALLAATYDEEKPETEYEYYAVKQNEFLGENSPKIMMHSKVGVPIYSQFLEMNYNRKIKRPTKPLITSFSIIVSSSSFGSILADISSANAG
jgi:hypothetical protein